LNGSEVIRKENIMEQTPRASNSQ